MSIEVLIAIIGGVIAILGTIFKSYKYFENKLKNKFLKENQKLLTETFESVVAKLSSEILSEKISSAILLRRFFDENSYLGLGNTTLEKDTIDVIASMLKVENTGDFQKLLADSLQYANSLKNSDFQKANLTNAVLGKENLDFSDSDFYKANLTNASFKDKNGKGANLTSCVFYESILHNTNFSGSNLKGSIFYKANFKNTNFDNCTNVPNEVQQYIDSSDYRLPHHSKKIFISNPRIKTIEQEVIFENICNKVKEKGFELCLIEKLEEQNHAILTRIKEKAEECSGMIIFDFLQYEIIEGRYRWWNKKESKIIKNTYSSSPWIHIESGMAIMNNIPLFIITDLSKEECIFNLVNESNIINVNNYKTKPLDKITTELNSWTKALS